MNPSITAILDNQEDLERLHKQFKDAGIQTHLVRVVGEDALYITFPNGVILNLQQV